jgi:hypothetical protein
MRVEAGSVRTVMFVHRAISHLRSEGQDQFNEPPGIVSVWQLNVM